MQREPVEAQTFKPSSQPAKQEQKQGDPHQDQFETLELLQIEKSKSQQVGKGFKQTTIQNTPNKPQSKNQTIPTCTLEDFLRKMLEAFSSTTLKQDYLVLDKEVSQQLRDVYAKITTQEQLESPIFNFLDAELGTRRTPFEGWNYKKLINSLEKSQLVSKFHIDILVKKTHRFIDKESIHKEKENYRKIVRDSLMVSQKNAFVSSQDEEDKESSLDSKAYSVQPTPHHNKKLVVIRDDQWMDCYDDQIEADVDSVDSMPAKIIVQNSYLKVYKERVQGEQIERYEQVRRAHMVFRLNGFDSEEGQRAVLKAETLIHQIYHEQMPDKTDLEQRDQVIERVKEAFYSCKKPDYPSVLDGEVTVVATGSSQNGLWTVSGSDIDIVVVFHNRMAHNQHFLIKHCGKIVKKCAKPGTLCYVPAVKVPILRYKDLHTSVDVDVSVNNILAMYNSELIYAYCQVDQRFHILATFLKHWAKQVNIIGAPNGYLSSYALTLMVIAFLQSRQPPVLPCLQARKLRTQQPKSVYYPVPIEELESKKRRRGFKDNRENSNDAKMFCMFETDAFFETDINVIKNEYLPKEGKRNTASVGQLLYEFFVFFLYEFEAANTVISIKENGGFTRKFQPDKLPFSIVDPFDVHKNPGRTVKMGSQPHKQIMHQFRAALDRFTK